MNNNNKYFLLVETELNIYNRTKYYHNTPHYSLSKRTKILNTKVALKYSYRLPKVSHRLSIANIQEEKYLNYCENREKREEHGKCEKCGEQYADIKHKWCRSCHIDYLKRNFTNWTSGSEKIDDLVQEMQLQVNKHNDIIIEWIPYDQFNNIKEISEINFSKVYSAKWKDGPLNYDHDKRELKRIPNRFVSLKCLKIANADEFLTKVKVHLTNCKIIYGISQNPDTRYYIIVFKDEYCVKCSKKYTNVKYKWCKLCQIDCLKNNFTNWTSGEEKVVNFIQGAQLQLNAYNDIIFEWIPYNHKMELKRMISRSVTLKYLEYASINEFLTKVKIYLTNTGNYKIYGISQHPDTKNFIMVFQDKYYIEYSKNYCKKCGEVYTNIKFKWCKPCQINKLKLNFSENKIINELILEMQLKINSPIDIVFEWIPCNQFKDIKKIGKNDFEIVYSAIWKNGPLYFDGKKWIRKSNTKVALECLYNLQNNINVFLHKVKTYSINTYNDCNIQIYGISQNPNTNDYIIVLQHKYCEEYSKKCCEVCMEKFTNIMYKWCKPCQVNCLKKNFKIWTSTIWKNGPMYYNYSKNKLARRSNRKIALKCLHNSQNTINEFLNKVNMFLTHENNNIFKIYGISQNPDTRNYIIVLQDKYYKEYGKSYCMQCIKKYTDIENKWCKPCQTNYLKSNFTKWTSGNEKVDHFIQKAQLKIKSYSDMIFEWIPYNQFTNKSGRYDFIKIWKNGPLYYDYNSRTMLRKSNKEVGLKHLYNSHNMANKFLHEVEMYLTNTDCKAYGISQNPDTKDYIIVIQDGYCVKCDKKCTSTKYNWFDFVEVYSAQWKDGPLIYDIDKMELKRTFYRNVTLKCLRVTNVDEFLTKVNSYLTNTIDCKIYGISRNPVTKNYIIVLQDVYCIKCDIKCTSIKYNWCKLCQINYFKNNFPSWTSENKKIDEFIQEMQLKVNNWNDIIFEWISYDEFNDVKKMDKNSYSSVYTAIWESGPLFYDHKNSEWIRKSDKKVYFNVLEHLNTDEFLNVVKAHLTGRDRIILDVYGISQNPVTKAYVIVFHNVDIIEIYERYGNKFFTNRDVKEIGKGGFATVYSAIWKNGPLNFDDDKKEWVREMNKEVALKCLNSSQNINEKFLNEANEYSIDTSLNILRIYGISQNPYTKNYMMILQYAEGGDFNKWIDKNYENFDWKNKVRVLNNIISATGRQPFADRAHDEFLALDICEGVRPELNKNDAPNCYVELMKRCWNSNPNNRPNVTEISDQIRLWKNSDFERDFDHAENYRKENLLKRVQLKNHPQAIYTSRILNPYTKHLSKYYNSNYSDCAIVD
ncbi:kinase-like domain-containing protein [Rhizophagus clarus]|uniref:Kinase-like domain-containing protein n=1 Tax=Rhizophagus clarus TaxID=94130 RepID=A0A8H3KYY2_9GLOM|nr:kinase-like domain-containing protein [Rhizophagus clarus]